jgi:hypothetical protein
MDPLFSQRASQRVSGFISALITEAKHTPVNADGLPSLQIPEDHYCLLRINVVVRH